MNKKIAMEDLLHYEFEHSKPEFLEALQRLISCDELRECRKETFQLLYDIISGKKKFKKGHPKGSLEQDLREEEICALYIARLKNGIKGLSAIIEIGGIVGVEERTVRYVLKRHNLIKTAKKV